MTFGTLERVGLEAEMGRNPLSHFMWDVGFAGASGDTLSFEQQSQTPLPIPAFLSMVASVPTTLSTGQWYGFGPGSLHSGAAASWMMFLCVVEPWTPSRVSMFLGEEKWGAPHIPPCIEAPLVNFTYVAT